MEANKEIEIIPYNETVTLEIGKKYLAECGIEFTYTDNTEKPFELNNGIYIDHIPTATDTRLLNLIRLDRLPEDKHKELAIKGGTNSQASQLKRKSFKESLELFLSLSINESQLRKIDSSIVDKIPEDIRKQLTQADLITLKQIELSQDGSEKHSVFVRDTVGEKPTDHHEITADVITDGDRALIEKLSKRLNIEE